MQKVNQNNHNDRYIISDNVSPSSPPPVSPDFVLPVLATEVYIIPSPAAPYNSYNESKKLNDNHIIQGTLYDNQYEAQPVVNSEPTTTTTTTTTTTSTNAYANTPPKQQFVFSKNMIPPLGCPAGGRWGTIKHFGKQSSLSLCLCCVLIGFFALPMAFCNFDRKRAYCVNGCVYNKYGVRLDENKASTFKVDKNR